ncbi:hypothetical protein GW17_00043445, partial [Ensete ventricosum]
MVGICVGAAQAVGLPFVRPYLAGNCGEDFRYGVNFAVGGATALDNECFRSMGLQIIWTNYSLGAQLEWFRQLLPSLCSSDEDADLTAKSSHLRTSDPPTWPTRRSWPTGCTEDPSCRTADLTQVRSAPPTCRRTPHHQDGRHGERCGGMVKGAAA